MDLVHKGKPSEELPFGFRNPRLPGGTTCCFDEERLFFIEDPTSYGISESVYVKSFSLQQKIPTILGPVNALRTENTAPVKLIIENFWPVDPTAEEVWPGAIQNTIPSLWATNRGKSEYVGFWGTILVSAIGDITIPTKMDYDSEDVKRKLKPTHDLVKRLIAGVFGDIGIEAKVWPDPEEDIWYIEYYIRYTDDVKTNIEKKVDFYREFRLSKTDDCHNRVILSFIYAD